MRCRRAGGRDITAEQYARRPSRRRPDRRLGQQRAGAAVEQVAALAERRRYESAARLRDRTATAIDALWRASACGRCRAAGAGGRRARRAAAGSSP
ncbi:hypothetical protein I552_10187 [Mycobacterium xenopi 3993]|nr:hypothetical protein I552_10187 [Mycobacterium xenopi 3993]